MNVIEASALGKRYGSAWALCECTLAIPAGHVAALVGPNGAGKNTLLNLAVGLAAPSALGGIAFVGPGPPAGPGHRRRPRRRIAAAGPAQPAGRRRGSCNDQFGWWGARGSNPEPTD
jgi:ABC-type multidrug transport system ATPase subunit